MKVGDRVRYDEPEGCRLDWHPPDGAVGTVLETVSMDYGYFVHVLYDKSIPGMTSRCPVVSGDKVGCWWFGTTSHLGLLFPDDDIGNLTVIASG